VSTNVYLNNLTPLPVNLTVTFPGKPIADVDWGQVQTTLQPFDVNNNVAWVNRDEGIKDGESYTMLVNVNDTSGNLIVSASIGLTGTWDSSTISIGAQNVYFEDPGGANGPYSDAWTDGAGQSWAVEFSYSLRPNSSFYSDVIYNFFMTIEGQQP
jgi:hypothetical protein